MKCNLSKQRLNHLDLFKGIAIIFIIVTHYAWSDKQRLMLLFPLWIEMAVPIFMVITGYVYSLSFEKRGISFKNYYKPIEIAAKWLRFIIPFIPAWILSVLARIIGKNEIFSVGGLIVDFFTGGVGQGSYYFPVMLQIVLLMPLVIILIKRKMILGLLVCFAINVLFEAVKTILHMSPELYRLCSLRYLFIIGYGCFLFYHGRINRSQHKWYFITGIFGLIYIIVFNYTGINPIITNQWTVTSVFAVLFVVPVMMILIDKEGWHNIALESLGKASFNIFLVQMVFYLAGDEIVYRFIPTIFLKVLVNIVVCCTVGYFYYKIETPITKKIIKMLLPST